MLLLQLHDMPRCMTCSGVRHAGSNACASLQCAVWPRARYRHGLIGWRHNQSCTVMRQPKQAARVSCASNGNQVDRLPVRPVKQLGLWTAIDVAATVGSVAGALAFLITSEAVLAGIPILLPLVGWYAGRQKEGLQLEVCRLCTAMRCYSSAMCASMPHDATCNLS